MREYQTHFRDFCEGKTLIPVEGHLAGRTRGVCWGGNSTCPPFCWSPWAKKARKIPCIKFPFFVSCVFFLSGCFFRHLGDKDCLHSTAPFPRLRRLRRRRHLRNSRQDFRSARPPGAFPYLCQPSSATLY